MLAEQNPKQLSPLTLAFVGDGVYELLVRENIVRTANMPAKKLNTMKVSLVRASAQAAVYDGVLPLLSEEEQEILKRGRNCHTASVPKNADMLAYRKATGLETLFGYLYLKGENARIQELFSMAMQISRERIETDEAGEKR